MRSNEVESSYELILALNSQNTQAVSKPKMHSPFIHCKTSLLKNTIFKRNHNHSIAFEPEALEAFNKIEMIKQIMLLNTVIILVSCGSESSQSDKNDIPNNSNSAIKTQTNSVDNSTHAADSDKQFKSEFSIHDLFKNESSDVVNALASEDFELVIKKITHYKNSPDLNLTETQKANFRYMHIYAFAGLVYQKKKTHEDLKSLLEEYKGQNIIARRLPVTKGIAMPFNQMQVEQENKDTIEITCANNDGFNIHCMVKARLIEEINLNEHIGKQAYLCGKLESFVLSDKTVFSWIMSITLSDGFVRILEDEFN